MAQETVNVSGVIGSLPERTQNASSLIVIGAMTNPELVKLSEDPGHFSASETAAQHALAKPAINKEVAVITANIEGGATSSAESLQELNRSLTHHVIINPYAR